MTKPIEDTLTDAVQALLAPRTVAVIGASDSSDFSRRLINNLKRYNYQGNTFLINPRRATVAGQPCYESIAAVPDTVDLALVIVGSRHVAAAVRECAAAGVKVASVAASGFAETGDSGRVMQDEIAAIARDSGMHVVGPNCMGVVVEAIGLVATFSQSVDEQLLPGSGLAYVGQSGAIGGAILGLCRERGLGLSAWCAAGNEADLTSVDIARGMLARSDITTIALYLESVPDGACWAALLKTAQQQQKRVVLLRSGRSRAGRRAAASHTGAMVRSDIGFELMNRRYGVITVDDVVALTDILEALAFSPVPPGRRVGVVTSSGGLGTMMADALEFSGLPLAELSGQTCAEIAGLIPDYGSTDNPVDVTAQSFNGDAAGFEHVCAHVLSDINVDCLAILLTTIVGDAAHRLATSIARIAEKRTKHIFVVWVAPLNQTLDAREVLRQAGIPTSTSIQPQLDLLKNLNAGVPATRVTPTSRSAGLLQALSTLDGHTGGALTEAAGAGILDALGIHRPRGILARSAAEATAAAKQLGSEVVMKIQSPKILHKTDIGGVAVGVAAEHVERTYHSIAAAGSGIDPDLIEGVLIQKLAPPGVDLILSAMGSRDGYPPVVTVGSGGAATELSVDIVSDLAPLDDDVAFQMLRRLRSWPLLEGFRGQTGGDVAGLVEAMCAVSQFAAQAGNRLVELEINPLRVHPNGISALDLLIELRDGQHTHHQPGEAS
jgi:acetate---CoA ligase (ADP-forming)